jgi:hypothetical protein
MLAQLHNSLVSMRPDTDFCKFSLTCRLASLQDMRAQLPGSFGLMLSVHMRACQDKFCSTAPVCTFACLQDMRVQLPDSLVSTLPVHTTGA